MAAASSPRFAVSFFLVALLGTLLSCLRAVHGGEEDAAIAIARLGGRRRGPRRLLFDHQGGVPVAGGDDHFGYSCEDNSDGSGLEGGASSFVTAGLAGVQAEQEDEHYDTDSYPVPAPEGEGDCFPGVPTEYCQPGMEEEYFSR